MNIFTYLSPNQPPDSIKDQGELAIVREQIIQAIMISAAFLGFVLFIVFGLGAVIDGNWRQLFFYSIAIFVLLALTLYRGFPYNLRAGFLSLVIYAAGIFAFLGNGQAGGGELYILAFIVMTSIFLGLSAGLQSAALGVISIGSFWYLTANGKIPLPPGEVSGAIETTRWLTTLVFTGVIGVIAAVSSNSLIGILQKSLDRQKGLTAEKELDRKTLQAQINDRAADIVRRLNQIQISADVSRQISGLQDPKVLLQQVVDRVRESFELYYVGVFLIDEDNYAVLQAGTGEAGEKMVAAGHRLQIGGTSMIGWCISNQSPRIALDVGAERVRFNNPYLPGTRSELALPILSRGKAIGAITIQSTKAEAFEENDIRVLTGIADSLAISLENAKLFQETQNALNEIESLNKAYLNEGWADAQSIYGDLHYTYENKAAAEASAGHIIQVPLTLRDQIIGQITLETSSPALSPDQMDFVEAITTQTALALENARLLNESERKATQEETLNRMSLQFSKALNIDDILRSAVRELGGLPAVTEVSVHMMSEDQFAASNAPVSGRKAEVLS